MQATVGNAISLFLTTSERLRKILKDHNIKLCHKPTKTTRKELCCMKNRKSAQDEAWVGYSIECNDWKVRCMWERLAGSVRCAWTSIRIIEERGNFCLLCTVTAAILGTHLILMMIRINILERQQTVNVRCQFEGIRIYRDNEVISRALYVNDILKYYLVEIMEIEFTACLANQVLTYLCSHFCNFL